jgi:hypothetical protein
MTEEDITATLDNWYLDPMFTLLWGFIRGDVRKRFSEGQHIHTSLLKITRSEAENLKEGDIVETQNSRYKLGGSFVSGL